MPKLYVASLVALLLSVALPAQEGKDASPASRPKSGPASGQFAPTDSEVADALANAVRLLVASQSDYDAGADPARRVPRNKKAEYEAKAAADAKARAARRKAAGGPSEWPYEGVHRQSDGEIPVGYRVGGTAITCLALMQAAGFQNDADSRAAFERGLAFCLWTLEKDPLIQSGFADMYDTRGWGHTYGLLLCLRALKHGVAGPHAKACTAMATRLVKTLEETEIKETGGWNYSRRSGADAQTGASPFMTAPTLQTLFEAEAQGFKVKRPVIERALKTLDDGRTDKGSYQYSTDPKRKRATGGDDIPGSCARSAACETTLMLAGRGDPLRLRASVDAFFDHWDELDKRRAKTGTHVAPYQIAPYYFHYGHTYVAQAIEFMPDADRPLYRAKLREIYWRTRAEDGSWNDRVFPRSAAYGTAMAALGLMAPTAPKAVAWK